MYNLKHFMSILTFLLLCVPISVLAQSVGPSPIVEGVNAIWTSRVPGPLYALSDVPVPVVAGNVDTPYLSLFIMDSNYGFRGNYNDRKKST